MAARSQSKTGKYPDITTGSIFGKLTVMSEAEPDARGQRHWHCLCECGNTKRVMANNLKRGIVTACGCMRAKRIGALRRTHGLSSTPEYNNWSCMVTRCHGKASTKYKENGIYVCRRWRDSFESFLEDIGKRPTIKHSLDRKDNTGNYTCGHCEQCVSRGDEMNVRWATFTEQMRNTTRSHFITHRGKKMTVAEAAEMEGVPYHVIYGKANE